MSFSPKALYSNGMVMIKDYPSSTPGAACMKLYIPKSSLKQGSILIILSRIKGIGSIGGIFRAGGRLRWDG
jgi:hypothetical protein